MGVAGLWDILRPAGQERSLAHLAIVDGFENNPSNLRGLRVGIDASIWFFHAAYGKEGENPELRTLFFRCARLMQLPLLPLFVFDGPKRPNVKRGKRISGKDNWMVRGMANIVEAFGFECRTALGEAEAELAFLNRIGVIDAIISDDVDNFLFGARMIIRNPNKTLSGNRSHPAKNSLGAESNSHVTIYTSDLIASHPDVQLTPPGLILIGLLRGGDYHQEGLPGCGPLIAYGLARCGFGETLVEAVKSNTRANGEVDRAGLNAFLSAWRDELRYELRTNSRGFLKVKRVSLSNNLSNDFPDIDILLSYTNPVTSESSISSSSSLALLKERINSALRWEREPDLGKIAALCELYFEWGVKNIIVRRFRTVIWPGAVCRILRRGVLVFEQEKERERVVGLLETPRKNRNRDGKEKVYGTPSKMITKYFSSMQLEGADGNSDSDDNEEEEGSVSEIKLITKIHSKRAHVSTDKTLEYRIEINPGHLVKLTEGGVQGVRKLAENKMGWVEEGEEDAFDDNEDDNEGDEDGDGNGNGKKKGRGRKNVPKPTDPMRIWMPACMVQMVRPDLVEEFEEGVDKKARKKLEDAEKKEERARVRAEKLKQKEEGKTLGGGGKGKGASAGRKKKVITAVPEEEEEEIGGEDFSDVFGITKKPKGTKSKIVKPTVPHKVQQAKTKSVTASALKMSIPEEEEETEASADEDLEGLLNGPSTLRNLLNKKKKTTTTTTMTTHKKEKLSNFSTNGNVKTSISSSSLDLGNIGLGSLKSKATTATSKKNIAMRTSEMDRFYMDDSDNDFDVTPMASQASTSTTTTKLESSSPLKNTSSQGSSFKSNISSSSQSSQVTQPPQSSPVSSVLAKLDNMYFFPSSQSQSSQSSQTLVSSSPDQEPKGSHYEPFPVSFSDEEDSFGPDNVSAEKDNAAISVEVQANAVTSTPRKVRRRDSRGSDNNSGSDAGTRRGDNLKKSPRKSREQTTPRSGRTKEVKGGAGGVGARFEEEEEEEEIDKLGSPSLVYKKLAISANFKPKLSKLPNASISAPISASATASSQHAKSASSQSIPKAKAILKPSTQSKAKFDDIVIDLCSDSDEGESSTVPAPYLKASSQPLLLAQSGLNAKGKKMNEKKVLGSKNVNVNKVYEEVIDLT